MRISLCICLITITSVQFLFANASYSQDLNQVKIKLGAKNADLKTLFKQIEGKSVFKFAFNETEISRANKINLPESVYTVKEILEHSLKGTDLEFKQFEKNIVIQYNGRKLLNQIPEAVPSRLAETINGNVTDENGNGLPGVSILIKDSSKGTITDPNGNFSLEVPSPQSVLLISFIGYVTAEVLVGNQKSIQVQLKQDQRTLDELVVVGYGVQKATDVTGAVARIGEKDIQSRPVSNMQEAMQGRMSGVQVRQTGGDLNGRFTVNIRGIGSVTGSNDPLIVVDGVPLFSGDLSSINPRDIVAMDVLKDASATAIFGARASNGVIAVTTRRGKVGKPVFSFSTSMGIENSARYYDVLSTEQQRHLFIEAFKNTNRNTSVYEDLSNPVWQQNTDWQKQVTQTGFRQEYNFNVSGGTETNKYAISASYLNRKGIIRTSDFSTLSLRANNDISIGKRFKIATSIAGTHRELSPVESESFHGGAFKSAVSVHSYVKPYEDNGNLFGNSSTADPYFGENRNPLISLLLPTRKSTVDRLLGNMKLDYELIDGLTLSGNLGADLLFTNNFTYSPVYKIGIYASDIGTTTQTTGNALNWVSDLTLNYSKTVGKHNFKLLGGTSAQAFRSRQHTVAGSGTVDNLLNQLSNQTNFTGSGSDISSGLTSIFGRLNYGYDEKYLLTATVRRDGSSKFGPSRRYGVFPSASVAWRVSEEEFLKGNRHLHDLKLRMGYGLTGNQNITDYAYITRAGAASYVFGNSVVVGNAPLNIGNPRLQWESAKQLDVGLDASLWNNRLHFTVDYYVKRSENLLISTPIPHTAGVVENPTVNIGSLQNKGVEFEISSRNIVGKFNWSTAFNITFNKNKALNLGSNSIGDPLELRGEVLALPGEPINLTRSGLPIGSFYLYEFAGIWQTADKELAAQYGAVPGDPRYTDVNNNGRFDEGDRVLAGNPNPTVFGGLSNTFQYGPFSLNIFLNFSAGNKLYNSMRNLNARSVPFNQQLAEVADFWTPTNPSNTIPRPSQGGNSTYLATRTSTRFLEDASFLRVKDISLGYEFPKELSRSLRVQRLNVVLQATNLLTFTRYSGLDPEASSNGALISGGIDHTPYPLTRMYSATLQIGF